MISGIIEQDIGIALLHDMLNDVIKADKSCHAYTSVVYSFARQFAEDIAGILPRKRRLLMSKYGVEVAKSDVRNRVVGCYNKLIVSRALWSPPTGFV